MKISSIFNNVLGPVMRGPSSSHTAASYHIGRLAHDILGGIPRSAEFFFDEGGSYGKVYREQGSDKAFITGLLDRDLLDEGFHTADAAASREGCRVTFSVGSFEGAEHPNWVRIILEREDGKKSVEAASIGGGSVIISNIDGYTVDLRGDSWTLLVEAPRESEASVSSLLASYGHIEAKKNKSASSLLILQTGVRPPESVEHALIAEGLRPLVVRPVFFPVRGEPIFQSASELERYAHDRKISIGEAALDYECALLGISLEEAMTEMLRRYSVMKGACERVMGGKLPVSMQLLNPTAQKIWSAGNSGQLPFFGANTRAAIRAMAIMHANGGMDVVCAAPTGGSAGALPGAIITLEEELKLPPDETCMALFAAGAVGMILDTRATFAAEVAGCQVEIGAGGAMASAACVQAAGGSVRNCLDAAAIAFQNTMGSVCDPVQGIVEIPCHTRNASAAAGAFVNADLIMGGYENPIPLDETIDAVYAVGQMLPMELRCTSLGGLSICPSALAMKNLRN